MSYTIPNTFASQSGNVPASQLDTNFTTGINAINGAFLVGLFGSIPAPDGVGNGRYYFATDQNGGTLYRDNGSAWVQVAAGVSTAVYSTILNTNPNWLIDQINEGALYTINAGSVQTVDGWTGEASGAGTFKVRQLTDPDNAALKCLEITCTTADAAIGATDKYDLYTAIHGDVSAALMIGTALAKQITVSFNFKSTVSGVYGLAFSNLAGNRNYIATFTVPDANEHTYTITLTLDTTGTWNYVTGGLYVKLTLAAGSNVQGTATTWQAGALQTTSGQCNFMSVNTNIAYLKRLQIVQGASAVTFLPQNYDVELATCQRDYCKTFPQGTAVAQSGGVGGALQSRIPAANSNAGIYWSFPVLMRGATPIVITTYNPSANNANWRDITGAADVTVSVDPNSGLSDRGVFITTGATVATLGHECAIHATANRRIS